MHTVNNLKEKVLNKVPNKFDKLIDQAIEFVREFHKGESHNTQQKLVEHILSVAGIAAQLNLDCNSIIAALLHHTIRSRSEEQLKRVKARIIEQFGEDTYNLVYRVNEVSTAASNSLTHPEIIIKFLLNSADDIRPIIIKLADVLHNSRMLDRLPKEVAFEKSERIFNIYGPIAEYLNLSDIKREIEQNAFHYQKPDEYKALDSKLKALNINEKLFKEIEGKIAQTLESLSYTPKVFGRIKNLYSIYNKIKKYGEEKSKATLYDLKDLIAFTVLVKDKEDCYEVLLLLADFFSLENGKVADYIANPKLNGFQALKAYLTEETSRIKFEVQILTDEMHYINTYGPASHVAYKASMKRFAKPSDKYSWLEVVHKAIEEHTNKRETRRSIPIKTKVFQNNIYVFTPKGKIIELDKGATVIDFAYKIHTEVGNKAVSATIDGKSCKLDTLLNTGQTVKVIIDKHKEKPSEKILSYTNNSSTQRKIESQLKG